MSFWRPQNLQAVTGGRWIVPPAAAAPPLAGLSTDSRVVAPGQVFLALAGEKFDGHEFLAQAIQRGAAMLIISDAARGRSVSDASDERCAAAVLLVPDTLAALQQLAAARRDELTRAGTRVIAVVGSNGKTTTRHLIHTVLAAGLRGTQSPRSFNNHIGVPLTLLAAGVGDDFVVVEIGTNHPGEVAALARIVRPDAVVLTSLGLEHMEFFGTLDAVAAEETAVFAHLAPGGLAVLCGDEPARELLAPHLSRLSADAQIVRFGHDAGCDPRLTAFAQPAVDLSRCTLRSGGASMDFDLPLAGRHNAVNALAALAVGLWMGVDDAAMVRALAAAEGLAMRLQIVRLPPQVPAEEQVLVINDAYNANPDSVAAALHTLAQLPVRGRRVAVLGDMAELGAQAPDLHRLVGRRLAKLAGKIDHVVLVGGLSLFTAEALLKEGWPAGAVHALGPWDPTVPARVAALVQPGDGVLIKASRAMGLERLLDGFHRRRELTAPAGDARV